MALPREPIRSAVPPIAQQRAQGGGKGKAIAVEQRGMDLCPLGFRQRQLGTPHGNTAQPATGSPRRVASIATRTGCARAMPSSASGTPRRRVRGASFIGLPSKRSTKATLSTVAAKMPTVSSVELNGTIPWVDRTPRPG